MEEITNLQEKYEALLRKCRALQEELSEYTIKTEEATQKIIEDLAMPIEDVDEALKDMRHSIRGEPVGPKFDPVNDVVHIILGKDIEASAVIINGNVLTCVEKISVFADANDWLEGGNPRVELTLNTADIIVESAADFVKFFSKKVVEDGGTEEETKG